MNGSSSAWSPKPPTKRPKLHISHEVIPTMQHLYEEIMCTKCHKYDDPLEIKNLATPCTGDTYK